MYQHMIHVLQCRWVKVMYSGPVYGERGHRILEWAEDNWTLMYTDVSGADVICF